MSEDTPHNERPEEQEVQPTASGIAARVKAALKSLREWSSVHPWRSAAIGATLTGMILLTLFGWVVLTKVAVQEKITSLEEALLAWDERDLEAARDVIRRNQNKPGFEDLMGDALFILGGIKTIEAENEFLHDRRKTEFLVASRYLREARAYGFPRGREGEGLLLFGAALVKSNQFEDGIDVLNEALLADPPDRTALHHLLAKAHYSAPLPDLEAALKHNQAELEDESLADDQRHEALLLTARILDGLDRHDEALRALQSVPAEGDLAARHELLTGLVLLGQAETTLIESPPDEASKGALNARFDKAIEHLESARAKDRLSADVTRQAMYLIGKARRLQGDLDAALAQHIRTRKSYATSPEGLAATLSEAELHQLKGNDEESLAAYRRVVESVGNPKDYFNPVLPLSELRRRVSLGLEDFLVREQFDVALTLLERYTPLFEPVAEAEQRAQLLERWGNKLIDNVRQKGRSGEPQRRMGRRHLREAGQAYEQLAKLRFATSQYTDDLWKSAENYFKGQSYSNTIRILNDYTRQEPERRNPQALLRLGQSLLAQGEIDKSITTFDECIDFHPNDDAVYQARINAARAYRQRGELEKARELLEGNISHSRLTPRSADWRESLFELGKLMHELGQYEVAISYLDEYVQRLQLQVKNNEGGNMHSQAYLAKVLPAEYMIAEAHRQAAAAPMEAMRAAESTSEREKAREQANEHLQAAERFYTDVLTDIKQSGDGYQEDPLMQAMFRNCYMLVGSVLFDQGRYHEAREAYQNVSSLFTGDPFVLETYVQIAHCWRRLNEPDKARGTIEEAEFMLSKFPPDADFLATTNFTRDQWERLVAEMSQW